MLGVSSDYAQPITGQVIEVTWPVIGRAQAELTPRMRQKTESRPQWVNLRMSLLMNQPMLHQIDTLHPLIGPQTPTSQFHQLLEFQKIAWTQFSSSKPHTLLLAMPMCQLEWGQINGACHPGGHYWNYHPGALSWSEVTATSLKIGYT